MLKASPVSNNLWSTGCGIWSRIT